MPALEQRQGRPVRRVLSRQRRSGTSRRSIRRISRRSIPGKAGAISIARSRVTAAFPRPSSGATCGAAGARSTTRIEDLRPRRASTRSTTRSGLPRSPSSRRSPSPAYVVASWTDQGLHTRGTLEGFKRIASPQKWLRGARPQEMGVLLRARQASRGSRRSSIISCKALPTDITQWPHGAARGARAHYVGAMRDEREWPIARTRYTKLYLDARERVAANASRSPRRVILPL